MEKGSDNMSISISKEQYCKYNEKLKENLNNTITYNETVEIVSWIIDKFSFLLECEDLFVNYGKFYTDKIDLIDALEKTLSKEEIIDTILAYTEEDYDLSLIDILTKNNYSILKLSNGNYFYLN